MVVRTSACVTDVSAQRCRMRSDSPISAQATAWSKRSTSCCRSDREVKRPSCRFPRRHSSFFAAPRLQRFLPAPCPCAAAHAPASAMRSLLARACSRSAWHWIWADCWSLMQAWRPALICSERGCSWVSCCVRLARPGCWRSLQLHETRRSGRNSGSGKRPLPLCRFSSRRPCIPQQSAVYR